MAGQPGVRDPEHGLEQAKPVRVNTEGWRTAGRGEEGVYGGQGEGPAGHLHDVSGSSTEYTHAHPALREGDF